MSSNKNYNDIFDDNFEVTYNEDESIFDIKTKDTFTKKSDNYYSQSNAQKHNVRHDIYEDNKDSTSGHSELYERPQKRKRSRGAVPLAAPIRKGGKALSRLTGVLIRQLSLILILAISAFVTYNFWRASTPYGDVFEAIRQKSISPSLASYFSVAAVFLCFEFISILWAMTRVRVSDGRETWKEDTGRGLFSFICVFTVSYVCFLFSGYLPDSPEILFGFKGALEVFGSLHNALFGLCAAGVISCLVRKYFS